MAPSTETTKPDVIATSTGKVFEVADHPLTDAEIRAQYGDFVAEFQSMLETNKETARDFAITVYEDADAILKGRSDPAGRRPPRPPSI